MLTCEGLTCVRDGKVIFEDLGFTLGGGGVLVIRGGESSGKTSLLRIIAGLLKPSTGSISWCEDDIWDDFGSYAASMQYISHKNAIKPELTVEENLTFWAKLHGSVELVLPTLHYFELNDMSDAICAKLSKEMQKRVAIARIMACKSYLWLFDDPMTDLDPRTRELATNMIMIKCNDGGTAVIASRDKVNDQFIQEIFIEDFK